MITDCFGGSYYSGLHENDFISIVERLMVLVVPAAIGYALWRIFVTNRIGPAGTSVLGLDENSTTYTELYGRRISWGSISLYVLTSVVTFKLGVLAFEVFRYVMDLLSAWVS